MLSLPKYVLLLLFFLVTSGLAIGQQARDTRSSEASIKAYVKALIKVYDKDKNGILEASEADSMRRSPFGADRDGNGDISQEELEQYLFSRIMPPLKQQGGEANVVPSLKDRVKIAVEGSRITVVGDPDDVAAIENEIRKSVNSEVAEALIRLNVWIVVSRKPLDISDFEGKAKSAVIKTISQASGNSQMEVEKLYLGVVEGGDTEISSAQQLPVVQGVSETRRGTVTQTSNYEVGTKMNVEVNSQGGYVMLDCNIDKSTVMQSEVTLMKEDEKEVYAPIVRQLTFDNVVACKNSQASVIQLNQDSYSWTLIFVAEKSQ